MKMESIDAVITDPPYSSFWNHSAGTGSRYLTSRRWAEKAHAGSAGISCPDFAGEDRSPRAWLKWASLWLTECYRLARPGAVCAACTDWRQLPNLADALSIAGWKWRGILVWDKTNCVRPIKGWFSNQCEFVVVGQKGKPCGDRRPVYPGCYLRQRAPRDRIHQVQKPVELVEFILQVVRPKGVILDPFAGSATTGVAALKTGRSFIGIEMLPEYFAIATRRLRALRQPLNLAAA
jgi:site-specific DNA-methyltransferase (adenine-specific)